MKAMGSLAFVIQMFYGIALFQFLKVDKVHSLDCDMISNTNTNNGNTDLTSAFASNCVNGDCVNGICVCKRGWYGPNCQYCYGKVRATGTSGWISEGPGNYTSNMKCSWLIEASSPTPIIIRIEEFETECGWDHLYIYDGDNTHAPLLGVFSGSLVQKYNSVLRLPEVVAKSGSAFLHFSTDSSYNSTGFTISYRMYSCPSIRTDWMTWICSGNGFCSNGNCECYSDYKGVACEIERCPNNCSNDSNQGSCNKTKRKCDCKDGFLGNDCSQTEKNGYWEVVVPESPVPAGSASHCSVIFKDNLWVFGGSRLNLEPNESILQRFDFKTLSWKIIQPKHGPTSSYGYSCVVFQNVVYLYGGVYDGRKGNRHVSNDLWSFDLISNVWTQVTVKANQCMLNMCGPLHLSGHSAVLINEEGGKNSKMLIILGYSPQYGYVNQIQEFDFGSGNWNVVLTKGYPVRGSYGHSSSWDPITQKIYVYGGYRIDYNDIVHLSDRIFSYDPNIRTWKMLEVSPGGRFLHTSIIYKGLLFVFGGCAHNDTTYSMGSKCFTDEVLIYDTKCDLWSSMIPSVPIPADIARYGLSSVIYIESIYLYGGFNGIIQSDLIRYKPPSCNSFTDQKDCQNSLSMGAKCSWNKAQKSCEDFYGNCVTMSSDHVSVGNATYRVSDVELVTRDQSCANFTSCTNCTLNRCIWCNNLNICVDRNAYVISFPFGQCMSWTEDTKMCYTKDPHSVANSVSVCDVVVTCDTCLSLPSCGWCDDGSGKGLGRCMDGSSRGPLDVNSTSAVVNWTFCPSKVWHFTDCPDCQCNGHSTCDDKNKCQKCEGNTEGVHCERCSSGYYGNALNGGQCKPCECNGQADTCLTETGRCFCTTKGVTGEDCGRCDTQNYYFGDPKNGSCVYDVQFGYRFTFNLSKEADRHYTRINFRNSPTKPGIDAEFQITCSILAKMNISYIQGVSSPMPLFENMNCSTFRYRFSKNIYSFGGQENTTIYVYVYDFQPPLWIQISFSQSPKLDFSQFLFAFLKIFPMLLFAILLVFVVWKLIQYFNMRSRRQQSHVEVREPSESHL